MWKQYLRKPRRKSGGNNNHDLNYDCMNIGIRHGVWHMIILGAIEALKQVNPCHGSWGIFPGLFDKSHGLFSQNSSFMISRCCIVI